MESKPMLKSLLHIIIAVVLTVLTQIGGIAWLLGLLFKRRLLGFVSCYFLLWCVAIVIAPFGNRVPLHCWQNDALQMQSWFYCAANRNYMDPELLAVLEDASLALQDHFPNAKVQVLEANFPFLKGFPLLPHLSHDDGEKVDLAFFYMKHGKSVGTKTPSPIGYFAFEKGTSNCPPVWLTMRWDLEWLQSLWPAMDLDEERTKRLIELLVSDERISKLFIEPHLVTTLDVSDPKIRFQGCRAARHDDHIHLQL